MVEACFCISIRSVFVEFACLENGVKEQDFLNFRLALAVQLVGTCRKLQRALASVLQLDSTQNNLPECVSYKIDCLICSKAC